MRAEALRTLRFTAPPPPFHSPGKASNSTAGGRHLSHLCARHRLPQEDVSVTVMDADTLLSARYVIRIDNMLTAWRDSGDEKKVTGQMFTPYM